MGFDFNFLLFFFLHHVNGQVRQIADDRFDVATDIADFGKFGGFDFDERRLGELGEPPRDFGLADPGGTDHDDILRRDFFAQIFRHQLAPPAIAQRDSDGALGLLLADDVTIELGNNLPRRHHRRRSCAWVGRNS